MAASRDPRGSPALVGGPRGFEVVPVIVVVTYVQAEHDATGLGQFAEYGRGVPPCHDTSPLGSTWAV